MSTHPGAHRKVQGSGVHVNGINQQSDDEEIVSPNLLEARTFVHKKEECHARAQERWEEVSIHLMQRRMSNGGKGRKITINASGLTCVTYEGYLRQEFLENAFDLCLFETSPGLTLAICTGVSLAHYYRTWLLRDRCKKKGYQTTERIVACVHVHLSVSHVRSWSSCT